MAEKRISYREVLLNQRTIDMVEAAEELYGAKFVLTQGSYNPGGVQGSAGTHDGGGAVDIRARDLTSAQRARVVSAMRQVGFAAWIRNPSQADWPWHVHGIAVGDKELSSGAAKQVVAYHNKKNGLASNGKDDGPAGYYAMTYEKYRAAHPKELFTVGQYENLLQEMKNQGDATRAAIKDEAALDREETRRQAIWILRYGVQTVDERAAADKAFDDAIKAGKSLKDAMLAAATVVQGLNEDLKQAAIKNG